MLCAVCGRPDGHCRHCHFVHDHMELLDASVTVGGMRVESRPAPFEFSETVRRQVTEAAIGYQPKSVTPRAVGSEG